jgi:hypothetical protein
MPAWLPVTILTSRENELFAMRDYANKAKDEVNRCETAFVEILV